LTFTVWKSKGSNNVSTSLEEFRRSDWHQQLGRKMCAAYIAQEQGIAVGAALKNVSAGPIGDLWLQVSEFARLLSIRLDQVNWRARQITLQHGTTKNGEGRVLPIYGERRSQAELPVLSVVVSSERTSHQGSAKPGKTRAVMQNLMRACSMTFGGA
jgi:hypothetical protein